MEYWDCNVSKTAGTFYHLFETVKMGPSGHSIAIVDLRLIEQRVKKLRGIDNYIMLQTINGNKITKYCDNREKYKNF